MREKFIDMLLGGKSDNVHGVVMVIALFLTSYFGVDWNRIIMVFLFPLSSALLMIVVSMLFYVLFGGKNGICSPFVRLILSGISDFGFARSRRCVCAMNWFVVSYFFLMIFGESGWREFLFVLFFDVALILVFLGLRIVCDMHEYEALPR